mgnify:CR=1 FL=1
MNPAGIKSYFEQGAGRLARRLPLRNKNVFQYAPELFLGLLLLSQIISASTSPSIAASAGASRPQRRSSSRAGS